MGVFLSDTGRSSRGCWVVVKIVVIVVVTVVDVVVVVVSIVVLGVVE